MFFHTHHNSPLSFFKGGLWGSTRFRVLGLGFIGFRVRGLVSKVQGFKLQIVRFTAKGYGGDLLSTLCIARGI